VDNNSQQFNTKQRIDLNPEEHTPEASFTHMQNYRIRKDNTAFHRKNVKNIANNWR
jgi:hypothetical protein